MKHIEHKTIFFWAITIAFILSLLIIFLIPFIFESFEDLSFRLLIAFSIFFGTLIIILLIILFKKEETQEVIREKIAKKELEKEHKKVINRKIKSLKQKFNNAIKIVRKSSLYKFKSKYELPWYLVMGEKNEGKTTFIESSELDFPINYEDKYINEEDESFKWYFAEHAVFVDLPGNYVSQKENPEDTIIWNYFLKFFIKRRWRRPINGIILSISVDTLLGKNIKELDNFAKNLRDRFDELSKAFMSSIPIYLVITKSDKIEGFNEYFNSINSDEKDEIFGITFKEENINSSMVKEEFEDLLKRLNSSLLDKMHFEWDALNKGKIFLFGEKISELFVKTSLFIDMCFSQTRYRKSLMLRGVYFTSVTSDYKNKNQTKSLFIKNLLANIIFPESHIIKIDDNYKKRIKRNQIFTYLISVIFIITISFYMINGFIKINDNLTQLEKDYQEYLNIRKNITPFKDFKESIGLFSSLENIRKKEEQISDKNLLNFLFFKFDDRTEKLKQLYHEDLINIFLPRVVSQIESDIRYGLIDFDKTWDSTKAYLMMKILEKRDSKYLKNYMITSWKKAYNNEDSLQKELNYHWGNLLNLDFVIEGINEDLLKEARGRLVDKSAELLTYEDWKNRLSNNDLKDMSFSNILENNTLFSGIDYKIPALFTKEGYERIIKEGRKTLNEILLNNWVIGKKINLSDTEKEEYYNRIITLYLADYKKYWYEAINELNIIGYNEMGSLSNQLAVLSSLDSPVITILKTIKQNTELYSPSENIKNSSLEKLATKIPTESLEIFDIKNIKSLRDSFKVFNELLDENYQPKGALVTLISEFNKTYQTMSLLNSAIDFEADSFKIVSQRIQGKGVPMVLQLNLVPPQVKKWYEMVIRSNWKLLLKASKSYINEKYKEDVYRYYNERLKGKYPLKKDSNTFVKIDDFNEFFKENGILDEFYNKYVSDFIQINYGNSTFSLKNIDGDTVNFSKDFVQNLLKAEKLRKVFFKNDKSFGIVSSLKPHDLGNNLATMEFFYDGNTIYYEHGPILNQKIVWPPQTLDNRIKFNLYDLVNNIVLETNMDNDWGLFKFIERLEFIQQSNNSAILTYDKEGYKSSLMLDGYINSLFVKNSPLRFSLKEEL